MICSIFFCAWLDPGRVSAWTKEAKNQQIKNDFTIPENSLYDCAGLVKNQLLDQLLELITRSP